MRRPLLQFPPDGVANRLFFPSQPRVPKSQNFHTDFGQPDIAFRVFAFWFRKTMLRTVQFNIQKSFNTKEIKNMRTKNMLPPEFVSRKAAVAQPTPQQSFRPRVLLAQVAGERYELFGGFGWHGLLIISFPFTPTLSRWEREKRSQRLDETKAGFSL